MLLLPLILLIIVVIRIRLRFIVVLVVRRLIVVPLIDRLMNNRLILNVLLKVHHLLFYLLSHLKFNLSFQFSDSLVRSPQLRSFLPQLLIFFL